VEVKLSIKDNHEGDYTEREFNFVGASRPSWLTSYQYEFEDNHEADMM